MIKVAAASNRHEDNSCQETATVSLASWRLWVRQCCGRGPLWTPPEPMNPPHLSPEQQQPLPPVELSSEHKPLWRSQ